MAYDEQLADRIRDALGPDLPQMTEKKMFGGLAFLLGGNMTVAATRNGGMMVRVAPEEADSMIDGEYITPMTMGGREMRNWLRITPDLLTDDNTLTEWIARALRFARTLPTK
ncbi:TfoX/Sxy family protein [Nocardia pseudobrasiliensis]|nr:TfoX/Sxy family protein [Nocardia pseudobrasiliensis]